MGELHVAAAVEAPARRVRERVVAIDLALAVQAGDRGASGRVIR